jgi:hypothetical protein
VLGEFAEGPDKDSFVEKEYVEERGGKVRLEMLRIARKLHHSN